VRVKRKKGTEKLIEHFTSDMDQAKSQFSSLFMDRGITILDSRTWLRKIPFSVTKEVGIDSEAHKIFIVAC